ncbi:MAG: flagella synthesis protein FlgN [Azonexus sp.]
MSAFTALLRQEDELVAQFIALLEEEQAILRAATPDGLELVSARKRPLIEALDAAERERAKLIGSPPGKTSRADMQSWLEKQPQSAEFAALWQSILQHAQAAKALHLENQELLNKRLATTEAALDILMQRQKDTAVYGSDGQTSGLSGSRIVDSA